MKTFASLLTAGVAVMFAVSGSQAATVDLDVVNSGTINGATFTRSAPQPFGSDHRVFLRYHEIGSPNDTDDPNGSDAEEGYNTDFRPVQFEELTDAVHTHSVLLSDLSIIDGKIRFVLDTNEPNSDAQITISLEELQIFYAGEGGDQASNFDKAAGTFEIGDTGNSLSVQKIYDMDGPPDGDSIVLMSDINSGSGQADMFVDIPAAPFGDFTYLILYARQGPTQATEGGFEEWGVREGAVPIIPLPAAV